MTYGCHKRIYPKCPKCLKTDSDHEDDGKAVGTAIWCCHSCTTEWVIDWQWDVTITYRRVEQKKA